MKVDRVPDPVAGSLEAACLLVVVTYGGALPSCVKRKVQDPISQPTRARAILLYGSPTFGCCPMPSNGSALDLALPVPAIEKCVGARRVRADGTGRDLRVGALEKNESDVRKSFVLGVFAYFPFNAVDIRIPAAIRAPARRR